MGTKLKSVDPVAVASEALDLLPKGAFLTVRSGNHLNTMTIGWGTVGVIWSRPVFVVAVRNSRYTFRLLERAPDFAVSIPQEGLCKQELAFCGSRSGKEVDKFAECGLTPRDAGTIQSPLLDLPGLHFACTVLLRAPTSPELMSPNLMDFYAGHDYHTFYFGEIAATVRQTG
ncbi:MAG: flavin reductase family protein [Lentisphaeria bacterium]|nr:flavin reductase family protein [Lentisphaeria bacterium]